MEHKLLYIIAISLLVVGCRQKGDIYVDPNDPMNLNYTSYAKQFDIFWQGMNTYYVFWSEDETDWDDVYTRLKPKFDALDEAYKADGSVPDSLTFIALYQDATSSLIDHHLVLRLRDVHTDQLYVYSPGSEEVKSREYVAGQKYGKKVMKEEIQKCIDQKLLDAGTWGEKGDDANFFGIRTLDDGRKVAYLWQSSYNMLASLKEEGETDEERVYINNIEAWMDMCLTETRLAGIILDNRCNRGGKVADLELVVGSFINEKVHYADLRYKEGPGRYDYTDWMPAYVEPAAKRRDIETENIPYIVLTNAYSISMAETSAEIIKKLPTGRMIGERTYGAHGQLMPYNTYFHDGTFGDINNGKHYVYTSSLQVRFVDDGILEGVGITPTKAIYQAEDGYIGAMNKALDYIKAY
ncbi:MAG: hypothetical protein J5823_05610 [Paludibacteraceae bacterium]|nr:hypothetical protein [Paludibacteraceae bacterium]